MVGPAIAAEDMFRYSSLHPDMGADDPPASPSSRRARWR